jgi:hypothetical protein
MTRREWLFRWFFGAVAAGLALPAMAATYRFTVSTTGSVLSQTASRMRVNTRYYPGLGYMVVALNGQGGNWVYKVNGSQPAYPATNKTAYKGDVIEWRTI